MKDISVHHFISASICRIVTLRLLARHIKLCVIIVSLCQLHGSRRVLRLVDFCRALQGVVKLVDYGLLTPLLVVLALLLCQLQLYLVGFEALLQIVA